MALGRKEVRAILEDESLSVDDKISRIIGGHLETVDGLKDTIATYKANADKVTDLQKKYDDLVAAGSDGYEQKYNDEHAAFEAFKQQVAEEKATAGKMAAYRALLIGCKVDGKRIESVLKVMEPRVAKMVIKDGAFEDQDKLVEDIKSEWADFIVSTGTKGAGVETPPGNGGAMTKEAFDAMTLSERMEYANANPAEAANFMK